MKAAKATSLAAAFLLGAVFAGQWAFGNGGPFVVKYPSGDPAAKGVLARLDPTLKPAQENAPASSQGGPDNPFRSRIGLDRRQAQATTLGRRDGQLSDRERDGRHRQRRFWFPDSRGIFLKSGMVPYPDVHVLVDGELAEMTLIPNSAIYGMIRLQAREVIERGVAKDTKLAPPLIADVRNAWTTPKARPHAPLPHMVPVDFAARHPTPRRRAASGKPTG